MVWLIGNHILISNHMYSGNLFHRHMTSFQSWYDVVSTLKRRRMSKGHPSKHVNTNNNFTINWNLFDVNNDMILQLLTIFSPLICNFSLLPAAATLWQYHPTNYIKKLFHDGGPYHIGTSPFDFYCNIWTLFQRQ